MTPPPQTGTRSTTGAEVPDLATFMQRFLALLIDWLLCTVLANGLLAAGWLPDVGYPVWPSALLIVEYTLFLAFFTQTPGMRLCRIHCVQASSGAPLGIGPALLRAVLLALALPILTAFSDPHRRGLHDKASGSAVVKPTPVIRGLQPKT